MIDDEWTRREVAKAIAVSLVRLVPERMGRMVEGFGGGVKPLLD